MHGHVSFRAADAVSYYILPYYIVPQMSLFDMAGGGKRRIGKIEEDFSNCCLR